MLWERLGKRWERIQGLVAKDAFVPEIREDKVGGKGNRILELKPLYIKRFFAGLLGDMADHLLLMSATILDFRLLRENLGLDPSDCAFIRVPSTFPKENRPIYYNPVGQMTFKHYRQPLPKIIAEVERMLCHYQDFRGIIHCHSFRLGDALWEGLSPQLRARIIYQKNLGSSDVRAEALQRLEESVNGVLLAPAFHEGLDLVDDRSRFQIICKVPYPDLKASRQLGERVKDKQTGWKYYQWLTALKLVQCVGRSVRHPDDWANTHILDASFAKFSHRAKGILPGWFREAVQ